MEQAREVRLIPRLMRELILGTLIAALPVFTWAEDKPAKAGSTVENIARWMESVVKITQTGRDGVTGLGAGWVVDESGLIVTNLHVIGRGRKLQVETRDGKRYEVESVHAWDEHVDLAILRVKAPGKLKALKLGDSDAAVQGQPVVAIGNPEGLEFSVVEGVVSAVREIDDQEMIQVAVPIERGNSGGPLMNKTGEVLGVLTLKSMKSENLGFAMPSKAVKMLLETPNPVPMSRWLTIGVLDQRTWKVVKGGAEWSQRAGVIKSDGLGAGMGGRTLAVWQTNEPKGAYEVAVQVRLSDESGAAGLIFCSDSGDVHYGFYPSNGQMRLTRFEGPDVYSWTVLAQAPSPAYKPGEWNHLRVRVEPERIVCWVNGVEWRVDEDTGMRGGRVGLCRFRDPSAEFKGFQVGGNLAETPLAKDAAETVRKTLLSFLDGRSTMSHAVETLSPKSKGIRTLLEDEAKALEERAKRVRKLQTSVHQASVAAQLSEALVLPEGKTHLLQAALLLARHDNPDLDAAPYEQMMDRMATDLKADPDIKKGGLSAVKRLNKYLFEENGFHGNRHDDSRSNSYINEVLDDREGLPIMLSAIYLELGHRLGLKELHGLSLPGRFMVGFKIAEAPEKLQIVDVADGGKLLSLAQAADVIGAVDAAELADYLEPATTKAMILRMIRNLMGDLPESSPPTDEQAAYLSLHIALVENSAGERVLRAIYRSKNGDKAGAREDISWLMHNTADTLDEQRMNQLREWYDSLQ